jgi:hypothetical protein
MINTMLLGPWLHTMASTTFIYRRISQFRFLTRSMCAISSLICCLASVSTQGSDVLPRLETNILVLTTPGVKK